MAYHVNHVNKKTGVTYVYESVSVWDKERKQSRNKQVCIGKWPVLSIVDTRTLCGSPF